MVVSDVDGPPGPLLGRLGRTVDSPVSGQDERLAGLDRGGFQNDLSTFALTLQRMDAHDSLLGYTTTTGSGTFLVLPGFDGSHPLGATLF